MFDLEALQTNAPVTDQRVKSKPTTKAMIQMSIAKLRPGVSSKLCNIGRKQNRKAKYSITYASAHFEHISRVGVGRYKLIGVGNMNS